MCFNNRQMPLHFSIGLMPFYAYLYHMLFVCTHNYSKETRSDPREFHIFDISLTKEATIDYFFRRTVMSSSDAHDAML